jgi:hypothetical protein
MPPPAPVMIVTLSASRIDDLEGCGVVASD